MARLIFHTHAMARLILVMGNCKMPEPVVVGGTYNWKRRIKKDGAIWDLNTPATAVVTLTFIRPSGTKVHFTITPDAGSTGIVQYVNSASLFDVVGTTWKISWRVTQG